jgi:tRNA(fMet)-specific endonuclease VapC
VSLRFLLDTNILSEPLKLEPNAAVIEQIERYQSEVAITLVTWHEIWFGCYRLPASKKRQCIEQYLRDIVEPDVPILPYGAEPALWFPQERSRLVSLGRTPSFADGQIAAIAYTHNLVLITNNVSDYADFQNLQIENWFS